MSWALMPSLWWMLHWATSQRESLSWGGVCIFKVQCLLFCLLFYPCLHHCLALIRKEQSQAVRSIRGIIWWSLEHSFRTPSSKVLESCCSCSLSIKTQHFRQHHRFALRSLPFSPFLQCGSSFCPFSFFLLGYFLFQIKKYPDDNPTICWNPGVGFCLWEFLTVSLPLSCIYLSTCLN